MKVFEPVSHQEKDNEISFNVWNRCYTIGETCFPSSIISAGCELLHAPMQIKAVVNNNECCFNTSDIQLIDQNNIDGCTAVCSTESDSLLINAIHNIEFDGCDIINLSIAPCGIKPGSKEVITGKTWDTTFHLDSLYLDVPLSKKYIKYYQGYPFGSYNGGMVSGKESSLNTLNGMDSGGKILKGGLNSAFKTQIYVCGDDVGVGFFFSSDENWECADRNKAIEIIDTSEAFVLRFHFFDYEPKAWRFKGPNNEMSWNLIPVSIKFGMQVTPIKPLEHEMFYEKNIQLDCYKRFPLNHDEFLSNPIVPNTDEIGFDRLKRLGVEVLYLHEKWNDIQNSFFLTKRTDARLRYIIEQCHKRGIKVVPYFGFELSSLSPIYEKYGNRLFTRPAKDWLGHRSIWYRTPAQRAVPVCMHSEWRELFFEGLKNLLEKYKFDGFYFDGTLVPSNCANELHGCGYIDEYGVRHNTSSVFETREFAKKIYKLASQHNGTINFHSGGSHNLAVIGFCSSLWDGEVFQGALLRGELNEMPESLLRAQFDGHNIGIPVQALCYMNPPVWTFREAIGMMLLHWSMPKTVDWGEGLELMSSIWKIFDDFKSDDVKWKPYYKDNPPVKSDNLDVKVSCYEKEDAILAIVATTKRTFSGKVKILSEHKKVYNAFSNELISNNGDVELNFEGFDFQILLVEKQVANKR